MNARIYSSKIDIDELDACSFWRARAERYTEAHPYVAVNLGDDNPERSDIWDKYEKDNILPLLKLNELTNILDIGCGIGRLAEFFVSKCGNYLGIDYSKEFIEIAKQRVSKAAFLNMPIQKIGTLNRKFDMFIFNEVLFYCNDKTVVEAFNNLLAISESTVQIYINNAVAIKDRLTLKNFYSQELQTNYNSIYRTEQEYIDLYKPLFDAGFKLKQKGDFEIETAGKETKRIFHILER